MSLTKATNSMIEGAPINVLDYGAVADYVYATNTGTDNTAAFQAAINAAQSQKRALYIPGGNYRLNDNLNVTDTITIFGDGRVISRIWLTDNTKNGITVGDNVSHLHFFDFGLVFYSKGTGNCIQLGVNAANLHFHDLYVDTANIGIYVPDRAYLQTYEDIVAARCNTGMFISGQIGGGGTTIRFNQIYSLGNETGIYVQYVSEVTFSNCSTDFTNDISILGLRCLNCPTVYVQNHHAEGISFGTGFGSGNIVAAVRVENCQSLVVNGLHYDLDGTTGPNVYAISSQVTTIDAAIIVNGITKGSYISASNKRISAVSTSTGIHTILETQGDWGLSVGYDSSGTTPIRIKTSKDGIESFGSDRFATITRPTGVATGAIESTADTSVKFLALPNNSNVQIEHKDSSGNPHQVVWDAATTSFRVNQSADDNTYSLGNASRRWSVVYAGTGTINTSDENLKENIRDISDVEKTVAIAIKSQMKAFQFSDAVAAKGSNARIHFGVIAQNVRDAFVAGGLDPADYGVFCSDTWTDDDGNQQTRLGIRYDELFAFIISTL